jgi:hypothetical protein
MTGVLKVRRKSSQKSQALAVLSIRRAKRLKRNSPEADV